MFNADIGYKMHWELTDLCNLKCPMCPRTDNSDHCRPVKAIQNIQFFLKDVIECFSDDFLKKLTRIDFCGNFGDPCMARDFYEICEFLNKNYGITFSVSTNGSMRNASWWRKLGKLFSGTGSWFEFHIDGLKDTNHIYRINANWDKIMANAKAYISEGARADWHYILFKHNQHQIDAAHAMARDMGFQYFVLTDTVRFPENGIYEYMHPDGDMRILQQPTISKQNGINLSKTVLFRPEEKRIPSKDIKTKAVAASSIRASGPNTGLPNAINGITCKASRQNRLFLDASGNIAPCCWVSNNDIQRPGNMLKAVSAAGRDISDYNIRNRSIEKILSDEIFTKVFKNLWKSDELITCRKKCGQNLRNVKSKIEL